MRCQGHAWIWIDEKVVECEKVAASLVLGIRHGKAEGKVSKKKVKIEIYQFRER